MLLTILIMVPLSVYIAIKSTYVQQHISRYVTNYVAKTLETNITFSEISYAFPNRITLRDFILYDQQDRPFMEITKASIGVLSFSIKEREASLSSIRVNGGAFNLYQDEEGEINGRFFFDAIKQQDTIQVPFLVNIYTIEGENLRFRYRQDDADHVDAGINFRDLDIAISSLRSTGFVKNRENVIRTQINTMAFKDHCGFKVKSLEGALTLSDTTIHVQNSIIHTPQSNLYISNFAFTYDDYQSFGDGGIIHNVDIECNLEDSDLHTHDLYLLAGIFGHYNQVFKVSADIGGTIAKLRSRDMNIRHGEDIYFLGDIDIDGLPNTERIFIYSNIAQFSLSREGLKHADVDGLFKKKIQLPDVLDNIGIINYSGNFTGFLDDFVAFGTIRSNLGAITTDIAINPDTMRNIQIKGSVSCRDFQLGELLNTGGTPGDITMSLAIDGTYYKDKTLNMQANGLVHQLGFNAYVIEDIRMSGDITHEHFDGTIDIRDPNLNLDFSGKIHYADKLPNFDFQATIHHANLYYLNIDKSDTLSSFTSHITAQFDYDEKSIFKGRVRMSDGLFLKTDNQLNLNEILLYTIEGEVNQIILKSDYLDARLVGRYDFPSLPDDVLRYFGRHLSWIPHGESSANLPANTAANNFQFDIYIKDAGVLTSYFNSDYYIAPNSMMKGAFSSSTETLEIQYRSDLIEIPNLKLEGVQVNSLSFSDSITSEFRFDKVTVMDRISESNIHIQSIAKHDSLYSDFHINSVDSTITRGQFQTLLTHYKQDRAFFRLHIFPADMIVGDTLFHINSSDVIFDSASIVVNNFHIEAEDKHIRINGILSKNKEERLNISFNNLELNSINPLLGNAGLILEGTTKGEAYIADIWSNPYFVADIEIDTLYLNGEVLGHTKLESQWDNEERIIRIKLQSMRNDYPILSITGIYEPEAKYLHSTISLSKLRANLLNPFLEGALSDIRGIANGQVSLIGPLNNLNMSGSLFMQRASFHVDYLNTRYSFTHEIPIRNNDLRFQAVDVFDEEGNKGLLNGTIGFPQMQEVLLDLSLRTDKLLVLNTTYLNNDYFFGKAYASGIANIHGRPDNIALNLSLRTLSNSDISIPITTESESIDEQGLVTFVQAKKPDIETVIKETVRQQEPVGLDLSFDLQVSPETRVQLIFDLDVIDIIRAQGAGNLSMGINRSGQFEIFGEYIIDRGDFWLNLQNVINKRFSLQQGSRLTWNGDPANADVDIRAIYRLKASLANLFGDTTQTYRRRVSVECEVALSGSLTDPDMDFLVNLPTVEPETRNKANVLLDTEEKRSRQFLSLLVFNSFWFEPDAGNAYAAQQGDYGTLSAYTGSEMLSNQISGWLSQFSSDVDIGVYYRPGREDMTDEMEVALSMQLLDEWVSISGHVDMMSQSRPEAQRSSSTGNIVGDFEVDVKVNQSGKLRVKAFHRANDDVWYRNHEYRQGVGISYREEFENFRSLFRRDKARNEDEEEEKEVYE